MQLRWWEGLDLGQPGVPTEPMAEYVERCPFCGRDFDRRDVGQVLEHFDHQLAADARPPIDRKLDEDNPRHLRKVIPFKRSRKS
jgi:hypothetical protein